MKTDLIYDKYKDNEIFNKEMTKFTDKYIKMFGEAYYHRFKFDNGYGASVVKQFATYGYNDDLFELAVIKFDDKGDEWGHLCYTTPITNDVIGYLTNDEVLNLLEQIKNL